MGNKVCQHDQINHGSSPGFHQQGQQLVSAREMTKNAAYLERNFPV
jgi:hypothetical protein